MATFFQNAIPTLAAPLFTANLKKGKPGNYNFGYVDSTEYTGGITYVPVNTANGFWEFTGSGYAIGSGSFVTSSIDGIADTGTTLLYLPAAAVKAYYAKVSGATNSASQGGYIFPCSATLPSITLGIAKYRAVVPGSYINYAPATGSRKFQLPSLSVHRLMILQSASVVSNQTLALASRSMAISSSNPNSWSLVVRHCSDRLCSPPPLLLPCDQPSHVEMLTRNVLGASSPTLGFAVKPL